MRYRGVDKQSKQSCNCRGVSYCFGNDLIICQTHRSFTSQSSASETRHDQNSNIATGNIIKPENFALLGFYAA